MSDLPHHLTLFNTLSGAKEIFKEGTAGQVKMYVCGITPYDESHLGHARCYIFFDTVRRVFKSLGMQVTYIQNFTDIDDKIISRARSFNESPLALANRFIEDYFARTKQLNIEPADAYPRVTQVVPEIVQFIEKLVQQGLAYCVDGNVFYSVRKFSGYGKLSKRALDDMESGARVDIDERKEDPLDFALWKKAKLGEPCWISPWGEGRPGWHIECSVMSMKHLGETFDIHGGGHDLIFPHHENEIAQSEGFTGKIFARYWLHNGFVTVNREKMSKSLGNFFTMREIFDKVDPEVVRLFLLSRHYRSPLDFSDDLLKQSQSAYESLVEAQEMSAYLMGDPSIDNAAVLDDWKEHFLTAMQDDFNTEKAIGILFGLRNQMVEKVKTRDLQWLHSARSTLIFLCEDILGVKLKTVLTKPMIERLRGLLNRREEHRIKKEWSMADTIRAEIEQLGYLIEDTVLGPVVKPKRVLFSKL